VKIKDKAQRFKKGNCSAGSLARHRLEAVAKGLGVDEQGKLFETFNYPRPEAFER